MRAMPITLLIAEDQRLFRQSLRLLLDREPDLSVIGEATDGREAFDWAMKLKPDLVLMDVDMPRLDGVMATKLIRTCPFMMRTRESLRRSRQERSAIS
jgi:DNA-binding NarL/FixJ family response regulator